MGGPVGTSYWSAWISEETAAVTCRRDEVMTGIACRGSYCDEVSMRCTPVGTTINRNCRWTDFFSEETTGIVFQNNFVARGIACEGKYCDNRSFMICEAGS